MTPSDDQHFTGMRVSVEGVPPLPPDNAPRLIEITEEWLRRHVRTKPLPPDNPPTKEATKMILKFIDRFMAAKLALRRVFESEHPSDYGDIVSAVIKMITDPDEYAAPDPDRIHVIDDGNYQGTLVYVIGANGYQPSDYWYVKVGYGSCSGCDTLESIRGYSGDAPTEDEVDQYMTLALHIVQGLKKMGDDDDTCE